MLLRSTNNAPSGIDRTIRWLGFQDPQVATVVKVLGENESPSNTKGVVLSLKGKCIDETSLKEASESSLRQFFISMATLAERFRSEAMYPRFEPSLVWQSTDESKLCALFPIDHPEVSETDLIRIVARAFYRFATGINSTEETTELPPLSRWTKFGGEQLSNVVGRCLTATNSKMQITTLDALLQALGRRSSGRSSSDSSPAQSSSVVASRTGQGLDNVAGMHLLKELLVREVVNPIRNPEPYLKYGLSIPNGILLYGPPGCGKTYIARQLADELGHYFLELIPSELASPYIHQSVIKIRDVFDTAAEHAPSVLFIDEFEALVPARADLGGHQQYKSEEVNEFLAHLNECSEKRIFVIAATNEPHKIDVAVRRTGRLDKLIYVGPPDGEARREMLALHLRGRPISGDLILDRLAQALEGYSASDLRFLVDEAAREALKSSAPISHTFFETAMRRVPPSISPDIEARYQSIQQRGL
jgi:AAA+ superfamily predicted ATPase